MSRQQTCDSMTFRLISNMERRLKCLVNDQNVSYV
ncbi:unnamed protein product [Linum tenue]|uniref:Uncharacterized protein n=1 Tax=Linum tenue TaxID=586396 RepID=A0AAV0I6D6_9ROSI|nr:unnamed protein product [Linum tenue]